MTSLKRLLPYLKPHRRYVVLAMLCVALSGALGGVFLVLMKEVLAPMLNAAAPIEVRMRRLNALVLVIFGFSMLRVLVDFGQVYVSQRNAQRVLSRLRVDIFARFQDLSIGYFEKRRTGEMISRMTSDLLALQSVLTSAISNTIGAPIEIVIAVGIMLYTNWKLSLFVVLVLPPIAFLISRAGRTIRAATTNLQKQLAELAGYSQEKIAAMRLIQTFGTRDQEIALFERANNETYKRTMKPIRVQATLAPIIEFTGMMGVLMALWFGARSVTSADDAAALLVFLMAIHRVAMRAKAMANLTLTLKQADAAAERLFQILDEQPEVRDSPKAIDLQTREVKGHIRFEDVRFSYADGPEVLQGISFEIRPGEAVALAGLSGSGKTTISSLVPRLYDPTSGRVTVDGLDLRDVSLLSLRSKIGAVPQETTLFHGTIRDNIAYGKPSATFEEIVEAARRAHADEFIRAQPEGYETHIGERGKGLSGGQQQRIAIARALLRDPKILILDEATSALDAESEQKVQEALATLMEGRTTLIIAHRFSTIQRANRILVLDAGRIVEVGTHEELLDERGLYFRLYQMQAFTRAIDIGDGEVSGADDARELPTLEIARPLTA